MSRLKYVLHFYVTVTGHNYYRDSGTIHIPFDVVFGVTGTFMAIVIALAVVLVVLLKRHRRMRRSLANKQHMSSSGILGPFLYSKFLMPQSHKHLRTLTESFGSNRSRLQKNEGGA